VYSSPVNEMSCPGGGPESQEVVIQLLRTAERVGRALERALEDLGLSPAKLAVLQLLETAGGTLSLGDLAQHRSCVKSNITKMVDRLEAEGLVGRRDDPGDRRGVLAEITPEGRRLQVEGRRLIEHVEAAMTAGLAPADLEALRRVLADLAARSA
jgi:DNA-binding MarR family transcriptional regulator